MDDEPSVLKQAEIFLEKEDERLNIETAISAESGLELLKQDEFDAIVSDYQMPEMDGLEFLETVRKDKNSDVPFIIFTGRGREDVAMDALNLGADRYLQKRGEPKSQYGVLAQAIVQEVKRKKVESEKEKKEAELLSLVEAIEASIDGLAILNDDEEYTYLNEAHAKIYGYDNPSELLGETWKVLYDEEERERFENEIMPEIRKGGGWRGEAVGKKKDGSKFPQEVSLTALEDGGLICVVRDISDRKEMEKRQLLSESSLDKASIEIYWITPEGRFDYVNDTAVNKLGYSKDEFNEMNVWDIDPNYKEEVREESWEELKDEKVLNFETEHKTKDGESYPVEIISHYLEFDEEKYEFSFAKEITERKEAEESTEFLHSLLRHNLENRAQVVMGYLEKLKEFDFPEGADLYLDEAIRTTKGQKELIEKVRALRKVGEDEMRDIEISSILDQVISEYENRISEKNIELEYDKTECKVQGGPLVKELFSNLIENSIVHSGCDKLEVKMKERGKECVIIVTDDGKGIPDDKKEKIFDRGFKEGEGTGFGLGLFLVKNIIEKYGGEIKVRDSKAGGARFDVVLNKV